MKRIGFFGGTFDPPHIGHLTLALTALHDDGLDEVHWVITPQSPLKSTVFSTLQQRIDMVHLMVAHVPGFVISRVDIDRPAPYYTVDTARLIREKSMEEISLFFILGGDSLRNVVKWYHARELIFEQLDGLIAARRPGDGLDMGALEKELPGIGQRTTCINMPFMDISSYNIRRKIVADESVQDDLNPEVLQFIINQNLYQKESSIPTHDKE